jgi:hypothetical protein
VSDEAGVPELPSAADRRIAEPARPVVLAAVLGGGLCLALVVIGLVVLGVADESDAQIAQTGMASIGATLAGGFAGWIGRGAVQQQQHSERRSTDPQ